MKTLKALRKPLINRNGNLTGNVSDGRVHMRTVLLFFTVLFIVLGALSPTLAENVRVDWGDSSDPITVAPGGEWHRGSVVDESGAKEVLYRREWLNDRGELTSWYDVESGKLGHSFSRDPSTCRVKITPLSGDGRGGDEVSFTPPGSGADTALDSFTAPLSEQFTIIPPRVRIPDGDGGFMLSEGALEDVANEFKSVWDSPDDTRLGSPYRYEQMGVTWWFSSPTHPELLELNGWSVSADLFRVPSSGADTYLSDPFRSFFSLRLDYSREENRDSFRGADGQLKEIKVFKPWFHQTEPVPVMVYDTTPPPQTGCNLEVDLQDERSPRIRFSGQPITGIEVAVKDNNPNLSPEVNRVRSTVSLLPSPGSGDVLCGPFSVRFDQTRSDMHTVRLVGSGTDERGYYSLTLMRNTPDMAGDGEIWQFPLHYRGRLYPVMETYDGACEEPALRQMRPLWIIDPVRPNVFLRITDNRRVDVTVPGQVPAGSGQGLSDPSEIQAINTSFEENSQDWQYTIPDQVFFENTRLFFRAYVRDNIGRVGEVDPVPDGHIASVQISLDRGRNWKSLAAQPGTGEWDGWLVSGAFERIFREKNERVTVVVRVEDMAAVPEASLPGSSTGDASADMTAFQPNVRLLWVTFGISDTHMVRESLK